MIEGLRRAPDGGIGACAFGADFPWMQARVKAGLSGEGLVLLDDLEHPKVGVVIFGMAFLLGDAKHALASRIARELPPMLSAVPPSEGWLAVMKAEWGLGFSATNFWHFQPIHAPKKLKIMRPSDCRVSRIDEHLFESVMQLNADLFTADQGFPAFSAHNKGYCAIVDGRTVCAAVLVAQNNRLAELTVYCDPRFRRRGIALKTCSVLLNSCNRDGQKVYWEAANQGSFGLARKLGFTSARTYSVCRRIAL
jgi:hypothetical protein